MHLAFTHATNFLGINFNPSHYYYGGVAVGGQGHRADGVRTSGSLEVTLNKLAETTPGLNQIFVAFFLIQHPFTIQMLYPS